eukprot:2240453-Pleurochrysis_carterae.AAC.3
MKTQKISSMKTHLPKKKAFTIETHEGDLPLHTLCVLSARRGGGKSVSTTNLLRDYKEKGYFDFVLLHVFEPVTGVIKRVTEFVENERAEWDEYCDRKTQWRKLHKKLQRGDAFVSDDELLEAHANGLLDSQPPKWKLKHERPARIAC